MRYSGSIAWNRVPGLCSTLNSIEVLFFAPIRAAPNPTVQNRVVLRPRSWIFSASMFSPLARAARALHTAARPCLSAVTAAAALVLPAGIWTADGRFSLSHSLHWPSAWGCEKTSRMPSRAVSCDARQWSIAIDISLWMDSAVPVREAKASIVGSTVPSSEFSAGTTPNSAAPFSTAASTSTNDWQGIGLIPDPKTARAPSCEKEPSGPRKATLRGPWTSLQAEIISRYILSTTRLSTPSQAAATLSTTSLSLAGQ